MQAHVQPINHFQTGFATNTEDRVSLERRCGSCIWGELIWAAFKQDKTNSPSTSLIRFISLIYQRFESQNGLIVTTRQLSAISLSIKQLVPPPAISSNAEVPSPEYKPKFTVNNDWLDEDEQRVAEEEEQDV